MFALLFALSLVMILGGAWAVFAGWELLLLERGWSMLIAGSTLATGGLVLAGVTGVARVLAHRLEGLTEAVRSAQRVQAQAALPRRPAPGEQPVPQPRFPASAMPASAMPASASDAVRATALGLGASAVDAARPMKETNAETPEREELAPLDVEAVDAASADETRLGDEAPAAEDASVAEETAPADLEKKPRSDDEADTGGGAVAGPGIEQPILGKSDDMVRAEETERFLARDEAADTEDASEEMPRADEPEASEDITAEPVHEESEPEREVTSGGEPAAEPTAAPKIIGRHVSGANTYTMYSDGSIEAETPDGRHAFASLDEFRGWINSSGDDPSGTTHSNG